MVDLNRSGVLVAELVSLIERYQPATFSTYAHVKAASAGVNGALTTVLAVVRLYQPEALVRIEQAYDHITLVEESIPASDLLNALRNCVGQPFALAGAGGVLSENGNYQMLGSGNAFTDFLPCYRVDLSFKNRPNLDWSHPLLRYALPPYSGVEDAIRQWLPIRPFHGNSDGRIGQVILAVPIVGPHLGDLQVDERTLHVGFHEPTGGLELKMICRAGNVTTKRDSKPVHGNKLTLEIDPEADAIDLWLVDEQTKVLDFYSENSYQCSRPRRVLHAGPATGEAELDVLAQIRRGESDTLEFKPFIKIPDSKAEEIVRTAVAFANGSGGDIYLGVNDLSEIDGVEADAIREYRKELTPLPCTTAQAIDHYCKLLRKLLADRSMPRLDVAIDPIHVSNRTLVRLRVEEAREKPVADNRTGEMFVRRGSSNGRLTKPELEKFISASRPTEFLGRSRGFSV